jgi:ribonuclease BN (tRNA processing enzyme)
LGGSSSLVTLGTGAGHVIDAGDGVARRLVEAGVELRDVGPIFLTHHHDDHTAGLGTLMSLAWDRQRTHPIHVYGHDDAAGEEPPHLGRPRFVVRAEDLMVF